MSTPGDPRLDLGPTASAGPTVSVVIPSFRRPDRLRSCLGALARQDLPRERLEVVVVDDGSPEPLAPTAVEFTDRLRVRVVRQANAGPAAARNHGATLATGDLLAFTDDDCEPAPSWASTLASTHAEHPAAMLGGDIENAVGDDLFAETSQQLVAFLYEWYGDDRAGGFFASNNLAVSREAFDALGGFDTTFPRPGGEDRELCERWSRDGRPLHRVPTAVVHHFHRMGLRGFVRQHVNYGRGAYDVHRRRAQLAGGSMSVEPLRFYLLLVGYPLRRNPPLRAVGMCAAMVLSQVANVAGYLLQRREDQGSRSGGATEARPS